MIDFYDYDEVEKFQEERALIYAGLLCELNEAKANNDEKTVTSLLKEISQHQAKDEIFKEKADEAGYYWS